MIIERELERVVGEARRELDAALVIVAELRASADGFSERIAMTSERLDQFDNWLVGPAPAAPAPPAPAATGFEQVLQQPVAPPPAQQPPPSRVLWAQPESAPAAAQAPAPGFEQPFAPQAPPAYLPPEPNQFAAEQEMVADPTRTVSITVAALSNLTVVSVVEAALLRIPGVREVALRQLQGHKAILDVRIDEGTGLISGLRKSLPLAFDVTDSSDHSLEISLSYVGAHTHATNGGGGPGTALA